MFDTVIRNGNVVFPGRGINKSNIGINSGVISAITSSDVELQGENTIDATNRYVMAGIIEPHSHIGIGAGEEDLITETISAAIGGVTTVLFFLREKDEYEESFNRIKALGERLSYIDFSFHIVLITEEHMKSIPKYIDEFGINSFKLYLTYRGEDAKTTSFGATPISFDTLDDGYIYDCMRKLAGYKNALAIVHAEDIEIIQRTKKNLIADNRNDIKAWRDSRPRVAEIEGVRRVLNFARNTGCRVNILHVTTEEAMVEINDMRKQYSKIYAEVCHPYLLLNDKDVVSEKFKLRPPLRDKKDNEYLWNCILNNEVDTIGSDHVPRKLASKMGNIWSPIAGAPGTPFLLPVIINEGYHKRSMPLHEISKILSYSPAKLYGLYPKKGDIRIGSDADLILLDLEREYRIDSSKIEQYSDYSLYEDMLVRGYPELTMIRGEVVAKDGKAINKAGFGKYVYRK